MAFIEVRDLRFSYSPSQAEALRGLNLRIEEGEYLAILGANGSGKSTLVRHFNGLLSADSGSVRVRGLDPSRAAELKEIRRLVSMVFQSPGDQIVATVAELDVAFGPENLGLDPDEIGRRVDSCLAALFLEQDRGRPVQTLSPGKQQLLALADALAMDAPCIVLDEANSMIAPQARAAILAKLDELKAAGRTIVNVTHSMEDASRADRVIVLDRGLLAFDGPPQRLFSAPGCRDWGIELPPGLLLKSLLKPLWDLDPAAPLPSDSRPEPREFAAAICARVEPANPGESPPRRARRRGQPALVFENVSFSYSSPNGEAVQALSGVSFKAQQGEITALLGAAGSGKSTALQLANALLLPDSGRVLCLGMDSLSPRLDAPSLRRRAALCLQRAEAALFEDFAADDVAYGPRLSGLRGRELQRRVAGAMAACGLEYSLFRDRHPRSLSGGERRRLALAGVLALEPELYLFDEPTSSLDPRSGLNALSLLSSLRDRGKTVVFSTHDMEEAAIADRILVFAEGRIVFDGSPEKLFYRSRPGDWGLGRPFAAMVAESLPEPLRAAIGFPLSALDFRRRLFRLAGLLPDAVGASSPAPAAAASEPPRGYEAPPPLPARKLSPRKKNPFDLRSRIALGQHLDIDSPVHALTPRMKYLGLILLALPTFASRNPWVPLACLALALLLSALARVRISYLFRSFPPVLPIMALYLLLQFFTGAASDPGPLRAGRFSLSWVELSGSLSIFLKLMAFMCAFGLFSAVASLSQIIHGIEDLLSPLKRLGLRVSDLALLVGITFRFVPVMAEEAENILKAQASRGSPGYSGGFLRRARASASIVIPLMVRALSRSEILAQAMEARCFPGDKPSRYRAYRHSRHRVSLFLSCLAAGIALFALAVLVR